MAVLVEGLGRWAEVEEEAFFQLLYRRRRGPGTGRPGSAGRSLVAAAQLRTSWSGGLVAVNSQQQGARSASTAHAELWTRLNRTAQSRFIRLFGVALLGLRQLLASLYF